METQQPSEESANTSQPSYNNPDKIQDDQTIISKQKIEKYVDEKRNFMIPLCHFLKIQKNPPTFSKI